ncbi:GyrI-like domain-containing protein [Acidovorax sp. DW039]|uniref:GyrI-like domain-containing protein n=1 Tax=Acidovorax sp. DW039 TaxID=3095606 RepID=UPI003085D50A|nr:GyrI-like domain-containing protein [Acidovorax sp. DW039]
MQNHISPQAISVSSFRVAGISTRTTNAAEADPATGRIGPLWDRFFSESWEHKLPPPGNDGRVFGVYSRYESDHRGAFDVTAGVAAPSDHQPMPGATVVDVQAGDYLVFEAEGHMPQLVIDAWGAVWRYFEAHPEVQRRFGTDFEAYAGPYHVAIHIGVLRG